MGGLPAVPIREAVVSMATPEHARIVARALAQTGTTERAAEGLELVDFVSELTARGGILSTARTGGPSAPPPKRSPHGLSVRPTLVSVGRTMSSPKLLASTSPSVFAATSSGGSMPRWIVRRPGFQRSPTDGGLPKASSPVSAPVSNSTGTAWMARDGNPLSVLSYLFTPPFVHGHEKIPTCGQVDVLAYGQVKVPTPL
jgi:hypothetical protein